MDVLITGGGGFLGQRLARRLLEVGTLPGADGMPLAIGRLRLLDTVAAPSFDDPRVDVETGDLAAPGVLDKVLDARVGAVCHLAAVVSGQAEEDFPLGMRVNLDGTLALLERCRALGHRPRVLFTSSVAVYGGDLPDTVTDDTALAPVSSYGTQKAVAELLLADYTRRGYVDGRVLRLPTVSVRPGRPNRAASSFASGIIREPLHGEDAVCPVDPGTRLWLMSPRRAIDALLHGMRLDAAALAGRPWINLPGVSVTAAGMVEALARVAGPEVAARVRWEADPAVAAIVGSWPGAWDAARAVALGFAGDSDFDAIVRAYVEDDLPHA